MSVISLTDCVDFLLTMSRVLMECGSSSNRVESVCTRLGNAWGFEVEAAAIPTGVWLNVTRGEERVLQLTRVKSWSVDLDRLARLSDLVDCVAEQRVDFAEAKRRLKEICGSPMPYPAWLSALAGGGISCAFVFFYEGSVREVAIAFPAGMLVQIFGRFVFVGETRRYLNDFLSAAGVAALGLACRKVWPSFDVSKFAIGALISLVPGLTFVNAVHEIAQKNLVSGTAKITEAVMIAVSLAFGVVFVFGAVGFMWGGR